MRRLALAVLRRLTDDALADSIFGDLDELRHKRGSRGRAAATLWFWREIAGIVLYASARRAVESARRAAAFRPDLARLARELRHAVRSSRAAPWYSATVVAVMALGIALAVTIFAVVDGVLFKPLPYPGADRLVAIQPGFTDPSVRGRPPVSANDLEAWQRALPHVRFTGVDLSVMTGLEAANEDPLGGAMVHPAFFDVLDVEPLIGGFVPSDFDPAAPRSLIVSYEYWQHRLSSDPSVVGREIAVPAPLMSVRVAGVMPPGFVVPGVTRAHLLMPPHPRLASNPNQRTYQAIARLPDGLEPAVFQQQLEAAMRQLARSELLTPGGSRFQGPFDRATVSPLADWMTQPSKQLFETVSVAALVLVLTACLNVSGLMAARSLDRGRDLAVRRALGARPADIVRLQVLEYAVLLGAGGGLGLALAYPILTITLSLLPHELHLLKTPALDARVLAFIVLMLAASVVLASIWPARRALQASNWPVANTSAATPRVRSGGRSAVVAGQIAAALVLVVAGALLVGSLLRVWNNDDGLEVDNLILVDLVMTPNPVNGSVGSVPNMATRFEQFLDRARRLPGVTAVGGADVLMLSRSWWGVIGFKPLNGAGGGVENLQGIPVTPGYFQAAGLRAVAGRLPTDAELASGAPVVVVSRSFAAAHWSGTAALGQQLLTSVGRRELPPHTIIGIVEDVRFAGWDLPPEAAVYAPYATLNFASAPVAFIRVAGATAPIIAEVLRLVEHEPTLRVRRAAPARELLAETIRPRRLRSWLFGAFAAASLALLSVGLFGLAAMSIARRTREIGVRLALGATRGRLVGGLVAEQLMPILTGLAAGGLVAAWAVRSLQSFLYELTLYDVRVWLTAVLVVAGTALVGTLVPSWRASRLDPMRSLRTE